MFVVSLAFSSALLAKEQLQEFILKETAPPATLYHWTARYRLPQLREVDFVPPGRGRFRSVLYAAGADSKQHMLYTFTNPVLSTMMSPQEKYSQEALVKLDIDVEKARAVQVVHHWGLGKRPTKEKVIDLTGVDLVEHAFKMEGTSFSFDAAYRAYAAKQGINLAGHVPVFREWVILNPKAIKRYTADPEVLVPFLKSEIASLESTEYRVPQESRFSIYPEYTGEAESWLKQGVESIKDNYINKVDRTKIDPHFLVDGHLQCENAFR